jgi:hypothetical protein
MVFRDIKKTLKLDVLNSVRIRWYFVISKKRLKLDVLQKKNKSLYYQNTIYNCIQVSIDSIDHISVNRARLER